MVNDLAQQALGFRSNLGKFSFLKKSDVLVCQTEWSDLRSTCSATIYFAEPSSAKLDDPVSKTVGFRISNILDKSSETMTADPNDWRTPLVRYFENPGHIADRKV
jgi:hypothetical protein